MGFEAAAFFVADLFAGEAGAAVLGDLALTDIGVGAAGTFAGEAGGAYFGGEALAAGGAEALAGAGTVGGGITAAGGGAGGLSSATLGDALGMGSSLGGETAGLGFSQGTGALANAGGGMAAANTAGGSGLFGTGVTAGQAMQGAQLGSSLYGIYQGNQLSNAAKASDPFAAYRPGYAAQLQGLMNNPSSITSMPGYQFGLDQGTSALTKNLASQGLTGSGTAASAITDNASRYAGNFYQQQIQTLSGLSGANMNNAGTSLAGQAAGMNLQNNSANNLMKILPILMQSYGG